MTPRMNGRPQEFAPSPLFVAEVTGGTHPDYTFAEVWMATGATTLSVKTAGRYGDTLNPGVSVTGAEFTAGDLALVRQADGSGGLRWELFPMPTGPLTTANEDETEESTTTRLEFDQDTGVRVDAGATDADPDVVSCIDASPTQTGVVNTTSQAFEGEKRFLAKLLRTEAATGASTPHVMLDTPAGTGSAYLEVSSGSGRLASMGAGPFSAGHAAEWNISVDSFSFVWCRADVNAGGTAGSSSIQFTAGGKAMAVGRNAVNLESGVGFLTVGIPPTYTTDVTWDIYADPSEWGGGIGPIRHRQDVLPDDLVTHGARRGGVDWLGLDADVDTGTVTLRFRGGHYVGSFTTGSPPPPAPPAPPPPPPPGSSSLRGVCSTGSPGFGVIAGRTVTLSGANTATTTTDYLGRYTFGSLTAGLTYVDFDEDVTEVVRSSVDGGAFAFTDPASVTLAADTAHSVVFFADVGTNGTLSGTVTDSLGVTPLSGRVVTLSGTNTATATTDGSGNYTFSSLTYGSTTATLTLSGGESADHNIDAGGWTSGAAPTVGVDYSTDLDFRVAAGAPPPPPPP